MGLSSLCVEAANTVKAPENSALTPTGTLPVLCIVTDPALLDKDIDDKVYRDGGYWLEVPEGSEFEAIGSSESPLPLQIKTRGNWTRRAFSKKPFKIKLAEKQPMLGLSKSKHFVLMAHADDRLAFLRDHMAFWTARQLELPWAPSDQAIELVINGDYRGLYFVTESIRVEKDRVNITELNDNEETPELCSGGYIVEIDNETEPNQIYFDDWGHELPLTFEAPEEYSEIQKRFITDQFTKINDLIHAHDPELWSYLDLDMLARYYIVQEVIDNQEMFNGSTFIYRDRGKDQKWIFSPVWDFGSSFYRDYGEAMFCHEQTFFYNFWIKDILTTEGFSKKVAETWNWAGGEKLSGFSAEAARYVANLESAAKRDGDRWRGCPVPVYAYAGTVADNSDIHPIHERYMSLYNRKRTFLMNQWGVPADTPEPARDQTIAAELPAYLDPDSGIDDVEEGSPEGSAQKTYSIHGYRVNPDDNLPGGIYIVTDQKGKRKEIR